MARDTEPDLHGLITARKAELELQTEKLSQKLQEVRDELEELTVAERVARRLAEQPHAETRTTPGGAGQVAGRAVLLVPQRKRDTDETVLPVAHQRIMDVVRRADTPVMVKQVRGELGMSREPARSEAMSSKLKFVGVGPITAAQVVVSWSHPGRFRSEAAFASFAGVAPVPASSGLTNKHRLNRGGDRQLNRAMHTITLIRMRLDSATKTYVVRRVSEGKSSRDVQGCLIGEVSMPRPNPWAVTPR